MLTVILYLSLIRTSANPLPEAPANGMLVVKFAGFYGDGYVPTSRDALEKTKYDISSLMASKRPRLISLLSGGSKTSFPMGSDLRLLVRNGKDEWLVSAEGFVLHRKAVTKLSSSDFLSLKGLLVRALPPPEEALNYRRQLHQEVLPHRIGTGIAMPQAAGPGPGDPPVKSGLP